MFMVKKEKQLSDLKTFYEQICVEFEKTLSDDIERINGYSARDMDLLTSELALDCTIMLNIICDLCYMEKVQDNLLEEKRRYLTLKNIDKAMLMNEWLILSALFSSFMCSALLHNCNNFIDMVKRSIISLIASIAFYYTGIDYIGNGKRDNHFLNKLNNNKIMLDICRLKISILNKHKNFCQSEITAECKKISELLNNDISYLEVMRQAYINLGIKDGKVRILQ